MTLPIKSNLDGIVGVVGIAAKLVWIEGWGKEKEMKAESKDNSFQKPDYEGKNSEGTGENGVKGVFI